MWQPRPLNAQSAEDDDHAHAHTFEDEPRENTPRLPFNHFQLDHHGSSSMRGLWLFVCSSPDISCGNVNRRQRRETTNQREHLRISMQWIFLDFPLYSLDTMIANKAFQALVYLMIFCLDLIQAAPSGKASFPMRASETKTSFSFSIVLAGRLSINSQIHVNSKVALYECLGAFYAVNANGSKSVPDCFYISPYVPDLISLLFCTRWRNPALSYCSFCATHIHADSCGWRVWVGGRHFQQCRTNVQTKKIFGCWSSFVWL